ncbi:MAG: hypothetical protein N3D80_05085 [Ignavibacterium album]|uniref:hypothetical protein n=1 Tax=Ignavibacterium album TaxID=591197 RepID=UPI0026ED1DBB|nr:hypothetical protein [Ignavibacterium album]MCX8105233.1 hypothetical protein [Ignavibacterium album]
MEDRINKQLSDDLKNLPKVSAPENFEEGLWRKIYSADDKKEFFIQKIFSINRFIPAAATLVAIVIVFFLINSNASDYEDPFMIEPPVREDLITVSNDDAGVTQMIQKKQNSKQYRIESDQANRNLKEENSVQQLNDSTPQKPALEGKKSSGVMSSQPMVIDDAIESETITKDELNFLKKTVSEQEKREILELKKKIKASEVSKAE